MSVYYCILFFILRLSTAQDDCTPTTCSYPGPTIRFPFRLKNHQPPHCGYPGFDLSCSPNTNATVLNLPYSVPVIVTNINYKSQSIHIEDPNNCFPQLLRNLSLSTTPFQFADSVYNVSLFSCPSMTPDPEYFSCRVTCLGGDGRKVYAVDGFWDTYDAPMIPCGKMYNVWSVPFGAFDQTADLQLKWPHPVCGKCEDEGKFCRFMSNSTSEELECFGRLWSNNIYGRFLLLLTIDGVQLFLLLGSCAGALSSYEALITQL